VTFLIGACKALQFTGLAGIIGLEQALETFQGGPIMYWLKYLSIFNAKSPPQNKAA